MIDERTINRTWYAFEKTLVRLDLIDSKLSVEPGHFAIFKTIFCPDVFPWDNSLPHDVDEIESDPAQLQAIEYMHGIELKSKLFKSFWRLFSD